MKKVKVERKLYLDRSRSLYLKNVKLARKINLMRDILNDEKVTQSISVSTSQPKISLYFAKKSKSKQLEIN